MNNGKFLDWPFQGVTYQVILPQKLPQKLLQKLWHGIFGSAMWSNQWVDEKFDLTTKNLSHAEKTCHSFMNVTPWTQCVIDDNDILLLKKTKYVCL